MNNIILLIPAYKPTIGLKKVIQDVIDLNVNKIIAHIVVVNDGSGENFDSLFSEIETFSHVTVIHHAINLGKGAALKTGLNYIACKWPESIGVVTLDADGQHLIEDVLSVAQTLQAQPQNLILGSREFGHDVPLRSRFGNVVTRGVMRVISGLQLRDTQTGLRGIPSAFIPNLLRLRTFGYDFELEMLLTAKDVGRAITEVPIQTVYIDGNKSSHFNPFWDSLKIYLVFLRFNLSSLLAVTIDYSLFSILFIMYGSILLGQLGGRLVAGLVNYFVNRQFVFKSDRSHISTATLYFIALIVLGSVSYTFMLVLTSTMNINIYAAKVLAETLLYIVSFLVQRDLVFTRSKENS